jgi:hypothetical protein
MKNLYEPATVNEIRARIASLGPSTQRQWGKMTAPQMVAHCAIAMEWAVDDDRPPRMFIGRLLAPLVTKKLLGDDEPMRRNSPTSPSLVITDERELDTERRRLLALVDRFAAGGPAKCTTHPHTFFGKLTPAQWAILMYKHIDHHLRQFGA